MQYILASVLSFMTASFKKNKVIFYVFLFFLWLLATFNYEIADKSNYYYSFLKAETTQGFSNGEIGQQVLYKISSYFGINFSCFLGIYFLIGLILIARVISRYTNNYGYVIILYFIYPFTIDVAQIRNFMAMAIMLNAIHFLVSDKKNDLIKYLLLVLLASSIHYSAIFYISFLLVKVFDTKKLLKVTFLITIILSTIKELFVGKIVNILPFLEQKINRYTHYSISIYTKIGIILYFTAGAVLVYIACVKLKKYYRISNNISSEVNNDYNSNKIYYNKNNLLKLADIILKINLVMFMLYPFLLYALEFIRLYRNILILNYILFANVLIFNKKTLIQDVLYQFLIIIFSVLSCWYFIYYQFSDSVFYPVFRYNYLFR